MQPRLFFHHPLAPVEKWRADIAGEPGVREAGAWETGKIITHKLYTTYVKIATKVEVSSNRVWMFGLTYPGRSATVTIRHTKIRRNRSIVTRYIRI
jgi:hypothetical protein